MNTALEILAAETGLAEPHSEALRLAFGHACVRRIAHLLEEPRVIDCLRLFGEFLGGTLDQAAFEKLKSEAAQLANQHRGSQSIDGCGHAAVSASYALANALSGRALQAASYAAYAAVYADGGYGAVAHREAFEPEFAWQVGVLRELTARQRQLA